MYEGIYSHVFHFKSNYPTTASPSLHFYGLRTVAYKVIPNKSEEDRVLQHNIPLVE